jgi:hypothetical protein
MLSTVTQEELDKNLQAIWEINNNALLNKLAKEKVDAEKIEQKKGENNYAYYNL